MKRSESTITTRGRTTVPPEIRHKLGLIAGTRLNWQVLGDGSLLVCSPDRAAANLLDRFDPERHGGEAMAFAPVGREFGSPEYEGLTAQDWGDVQSKISKLIDACRKMPQAMSSAVTSRELDGALNVQAALFELGHDVGCGLAATVWRHYSRSLMAEWLSGEETVESAKHALVFYCKQLHI